MKEDENYGKDLLDLFREKQQGSCGLSGDDIFRMCVQGVGKNGKSIVSDDPLDVARAVSSVVASDIADFALPATKFRTDTMVEGGFNLKNTTMVSYNSPAVRTSMEEIFGRRPSYLPQLGSSKFGVDVDFVKIAEHLQFTDDYGKAKYLVNVIKHVIQGDVIEEVLVKDRDTSCRLCFRDLGINERAGHLKGFCYQCFYGWTAIGMSNNSVFSGCTGLYCLIDHKHCYESDHGVVMRTLMPTLDDPVVESDLELEEEVDVLDTNFVSGQVLNDSISQEDQLTLDDDIPELLGYEFSISSGGGTVMVNVDNALQGVCKRRWCGVTHEWSDMYGEENVREIIYNDGSSEVRYGDFNLYTCDDGDFTLVMDQSVYYRFPVQVCPRFQFGIDEDCSCGIHDDKSTLLYDEKFIIDGWSVVYYGNDDNVRCVIVRDANVPSARLNLYNHQHLDKIHHMAAVGERFDFSYVPDATKQLVTWLIMPHMHQFKARCRYTTHGDEGVFDLLCLIVYSVMGYYCWEDVWFPLLIRNKFFEYSSAFNFI